MTIEIGGKKFIQFLDNEVLKKKISQIGVQITQDFQNKEVVLIAVLNGSFMFMADICRSIDLPVTCTFVKISSYEGMKSSESVKSIIGIQENLENKHVIIIEDIVDTGVSMKHMLDQLNKLNPASVSIATLLFKPDSFRFNYPIDYVCFEIPNKFVIGYGLDYNGLGRNLNEIYQLDTP